MENEEEIVITKSRLIELVTRFESALRMYKFVINNPKYYDRNFHAREAEHLHDFLTSFKKDILNESSNN